MNKLSRRIKRLRRKVRHLPRRIKEKYNDFILSDFMYNVTLHPLYSKPRSLYYNIKYGIENLFVWLPVIWHDRDWDEYFLWAILEHKFKRMEHLFRVYGHHVGADKTAHKLKICQLLCKRLKEEEYTTPYEKRNESHFEWFRKKFEQSMSREPDEAGIITVVGEGDRGDEPDGRWILPAHKHEEDMIQQDIDLLCKIMNKHVQSWWD